MAIEVRAVQRAVALVALLVVALAHAAPLPVETFFRKAAYGSVALSPSGRYLAAIVPVEQRHGLVVLDLDTRAGTKLAPPAEGDVLRVVWQSDERLILSIGDLQRASGEPPREWGMVAVDRNGTNPRVIRQAPPQPGARALPGASFERPWWVDLLRVVEGTNDILVSARERSLEGVDVYRYDTATGRKTLLTFDTPGNVIQWVLDFDGVPRGAVTADVNHDVSAWYVRRSADAPWTKVEQDKLGGLKSRPLQFDPDGGILYVSARRGADRAAIDEYNVRTGAWKSAVSHPARDLEPASARFLVDYKERKLLGLRYADDRPATAWFDGEWARVQKSVDAALPDTVNELQRRGARWLVVSHSDRDPGGAYLLDAKSMRLEKLFAFEPWIDPATMAAQKWVRYRARDGLTIPALLTLPNAAGKRAPLVVVVHGGPYVQADAWGYDPVVQFLASRGYAVLQPQFRGTAGFGGKLLSSGFRQWGEAMQDDLEDGVKWAVDQAIADRDHVCFYGGSYGGYAAVWSTIRNAGLVKCAVAFAAVTSLDYLFDDAQSDLSRIADRSSLMREQIGDPATDRARFRRLNPVDNADKVRAPILLAYGAADRRVPLAHGRDFHRALERADKEHEWVVYADEGHGFAKDENVVDFYRRVERFLAKYLGDGPSRASPAQGAAK